MLDIEPKWKICKPYFGGLHDPPILLTTGAGFSTVAQRASGLSDPGKTNSLSPAQGVQQPPVTRTPPPKAPPIISKVPDISGTALSTAPDGAVFIIDRTSTQDPQQQYTIIRQSLASSWSSVEVNEVLVSGKTDQGGISKTATGLGGAKTSNTEFGAAKSSPASRKMGISYWIILRSALYRRQPTREMATYIKTCTIIT